MSLSLRAILSACLICSLAVCRAAPPPLAPERAILILISIDGFRADYFDRFKPPTLQRLAAQGVRADGLIPQFPS
ncbi:MAG TPA: alkaline phosphatase family protein, partial [Vicinamibacterales bacterium]|nr:alkaline phosphatase family protein [Vicinamibacterales bacterium]